MKQLITLSEYLDEKSMTGYDFPYGADYIKEFNISCVRIYDFMHDIPPLRYILISNRLVYVLESHQFGKILCLDEKYYNFGYNIKFEECCLQNQFSNVSSLFAWNIGSIDNETAIDVFLDEYQRYYSESERDKKLINIQTFFKDGFYLKKEHREMYKKHISENKSNK